MAQQPNQNQSTKFFAVPPKPQSNNKGNPNGNQQQPFISQANPITFGNNQMNGKLNGSNMILENQQQIQSQNLIVSCDNLGSTSSKTRTAIEEAVRSVLSGGQATNPEAISIALRNAGYRALLFNGGHGFWWNFECEWSEWSWQWNNQNDLNGESYRIIVWRS